MIVWILGGLWHGATYGYLIWGVYCGLQVVIYNMYAEIKNGTVESLKLLDYEKIKENIPEYFYQSTKAELKEIESLVDIIKPEK